jgi:hypothetical protein
MRIAKLFILALLLSAPAFTSVEPRKPDRFEPIRELIRQKLIHPRVPSISVAVAKGDHVIWEESFGWADTENRVPATPNTMYTLGSLAKPMTAPESCCYVKDDYWKLIAPLTIISVRRRLLPAWAMLLMRLCGGLLNITQACRAIMRPSIPMNRMSRSANYSVHYD